MRRLPGNLEGVVERSDRPYGISQHLASIPMGDGDPCLTAKRYGRGLVGMYLRLDTFWGISPEGHLHESHDCLWLQKSSGLYTRSHGAHCEVRRRLKRDVRSGGEVQCSSVDKTVFVGIPGQVQEEEGGTSCFTLIPSDVWLVQRDQAYLFGGKPLKERISTARGVALRHVQSEGSRGKTERVGVPPPDSDVVTPQKRTDQMIQRAPSVVDEVTEDRPDIGTICVWQPDVDQLMSLLCYIKLAPEFSICFNSGTNYGVQGTQVFGCPINLGPDAAEIEARRHGYPTYAATKAGAP